MKSELELEYHFRCNIELQIIKHAKHEVVSAVVLGLDEALRNLVMSQSNLLSVNHIGMLNHEAIRQNYD